MKFPEPNLEERVTRLKYSMVSQTTHQQEVKKVENQLKNKKCDGEDGISNKIIANFSPVVDHAIAQPLNRCLDDSMFPKKVQKLKKLFQYTKRRQNETKKLQTIDFTQLSKDDFEKLFQKSMKKSGEKVSFLRNNMGFHRTDHVHTQ